MSQKVPVHTTKFEIMNIIDDLIENIFTVEASSSDSEDDVVVVSKKSRPNVIESSDSDDADGVQYSGNGSVDSEGEGNSAAYAAIDVNYNNGRVVMRLKKS